MKPFEGIRVLDLTHVLAGPFSTFQLATLGADVIKIESPDAPDMTRIEGVNSEHNRALYGSYFQSQNAGKRGITLNLKTDAGCAALNRLIETADVLVQNYAGNALEKLGFGYEAAAEINPKLIYCKISGFGNTGPKADHPAYDVVIQAYSGLMTANGAADSEPVRVGPPMVDYGTGAQAAFAISAALYQRQQTGTGQYIDVSMLDSALMMMSALVVDTVITDTRPLPHGNAHPAYCGYAAYDTADGQIMLGAFTNKQLASLLRALGENTRAEEVAATPRDKLAANYKQDSNLIAEKLKQKSADEWEQILNDNRVPAARVRGLDETLKEEHLVQRNFLQNIAHSDDGCPSLLPVSGFNYAHGTPAISSPSPKLGQHTIEVLTEAGFSMSEIEQMKLDGAT